MSFSDSSSPPSSSPELGLSPLVSHQDEGELNPFSSSSSSSSSSSASGSRSPSHSSHSSYSHYDSHKSSVSPSKSVAASLSPTHMINGDEYIFRQHSHSVQSGLKKVLGWPQLIALGVGGTIGAGIFVTVGEIAATKTGPSLFLAYIVSGFCCLLSAFSYAEFASMSPSAGSAYGYARATMGEVVGWIIGWDLILEYGVSAASVAVGWSSYFNALMQLMGGNIPSVIMSAPWAYSNDTGTFSFTGAAFNLPAILIVVILSLILVKGMKESSRFNDGMVILKVIIVLFVIFAGVGYMRSDNFSPFMPYGFAGISFFGYTAIGQSGPDGNAVGVLSGASIAFFSYIGFDAVTCNAEECKNPQRDLPIGIIGSLTISTILYVAISIVLCGMVPYSLIDKDAPISSAFHRVGLDWAESIIAIGALAGLTSVLMVTLMGQPRILMAMARDGLLPQRVFAEIHPQYGTPWKSTLLTGVLVSLMAGFVPLDVLVEMVSIGTLFAFALVNIGIIILRRTHPDLPRLFKCPFVPWVPGAGALLCILMMLSLPSTNWIRLVVWLAIGLCIYYFYGRKRSRRPQNIEEMKRQMAMEEKKMRDIIRGQNMNGDDNNDRESSLQLEMADMKKVLREASLLMEEKSRREGSQTSGLNTFDEEPHSIMSINENQREDEGERVEFNQQNQSFASDSDYGTERGEKEGSGNSTQKSRKGRRE